nr:dipeptidyl peptidase 4-like [Procambarus clarkii]
MTAGSDSKSKKDRRKSCAVSTTQAAVEEELASANPNQRNWKGIIIAVLVICFVLGMIVTSVLLLTPPDDGPRVKGRRFELEDILGDNFKLHVFNGSWISGSSLEPVLTVLLPARPLAIMTDRYESYSHNFVCATPKAEQKQPEWNALFHGDVNSQANALTQTHTRSPAQIYSSLAIFSENETGSKVGYYIQVRIRNEESLHGEELYPKFDGLWLKRPSSLYSSEDTILLLNRDGTVATINQEKTDLLANHFATKSKSLILNDNLLIFMHLPHDADGCLRLSCRHHFPLTPTPDDRGHPSLVLARWAPVGSGLVMVDDQYNIVYKRAANTPEVHRITDTGRPGLLYNGVPDWVYEEEILGSNSAVWFSQDGNMLAYASINDTLVDTVPIPQYGSYQQYSLIRSEEYDCISNFCLFLELQPGQENPKVTLWVVDLRAIKLRDLKPPNLVKDQLVHSAVWDHYFTAVTWVDATTVSVVWMNRAQNTSVVTLCAHPMYFCEATHTEQSGDHGWVELYEAPIFSEDGQNYLLRLPVRDGEEGEFKHVNLYSLRMRRVIPITHGAFEVTEILGWDQNNNYIYYMATMEDKPGERHLFRVADVSSPMLRIPECLSCLEADNTTDACLYNKAHLSPDYAFFVLECLGPEVPRTYLFSTWNSQAGHKPGTNRSRRSAAVNVGPRLIPSAYPLPSKMFIIRWQATAGDWVGCPTDDLRLDDYSELRERVEEMAMPQVQTFRVELEEEVPYTYHVQLFLPPGLREDEITTYPMVVQTYAAPGAQAVTSKMRISWGTYLASKKDIIYAMIDGRGSGFQGDKIKHEVYRALGGKEVDDQVAVARYLRDNLHFVDERRIAIWGWSYGGYVTTMALARDADQVFSCGIAVAPVARWEHYDSVYTERYMGSPHVYPGSNYKGYEAADATKVAGNLKEKMFLLIHGTADDNVHYQHSMMLAKALVDEGVLFQQMTYADENHGLTGVKAHLYRTMNKFLSDCYRPSIKELYFLIKKKKTEIEEIGYL